MDKIAIISDIHGNLEALKTVLKDIRKRGIDKIYCLGDIIAKGINAHECIKLVKENCDVVIQGNTDEFFTREFSEDELSYKSNESVERIKWNQSLITEDDKKYLRSLPFCYEFNMSGKLVRLFHATPTKINGVAGNIDKIDNTYSLFLPSENTISDKIADIVIYGHVHMQDMQKMYNRVIINAGSVGNAIDVYRNDEKDGSENNTCVCNYLILTGNLDNDDGYISYEFVNIPYDVEKELLSSANIPDKEAYENELRHGKYRDVKKLYRYLKEKGLDVDNI